MTEVPALHVRDVPPEVYEGLRRRARRSGRSLNAEALAVLTAAAEEMDPEELTRRLDEIARRISLPPDAPTPEELIRRDRDAR